MLLSSSVLRGLKTEVDYVVSSPSPGVYKFVSVIFVTFCLYNFLALFPHVFSMTSHFLRTFPLSFGLWSSVVFFVWANYFFRFLRHLIPVGTPLGLIRFIVLVEFISNLIRPIALTFRLTANIMAGHLLISIIGNCFVPIGLPLLILGGAVQSLLVCMELGVSLIQAYVFSVLLMLYMAEVDH